MIDFFGRGGPLKPVWYGDCLPSRDFPMLIDLYLQGRLDLDRFVSETIALDDVEAAFGRMERGEVLRSVVVLSARSRRPVPGRWHPEADLRVRSPLAITPRGPGPLRTVAGPPAW